MTNKTIAMIAIAVIAGTITSGIVFAASSTTELQNECAKTPKDPNDIKPDCQLLNMIQTIQLTPGPAGPQGATGQQGQAGPQGQAGSQIITGQGTPSSSAGNNNDFYLDSKTGNIYEKISGGWVQQGSMQGPAGPQGATGPAGPAGSSGSSDTGTTAAAVDTFLTLTTTSGTTIQGESKDAAHPDAIVISSYKFETDNPNTIGSATGGAGAGKIKFGEFSITKTVDKSSPVLFQAEAAGEHYTKAVLTVRKAGGTQDYLTITLGTVFVSSIVHQSNGVVPTETISFVFGTLQVDYAPQKTDGTLGSVIHGGWDIVQNLPS